jgi:hypothetical protein
MRGSFFCIVVMVTACSAGDDFRRCPTTDGVVGQSACSASVKFASQVSTTLLFDEVFFRRYYDLFKIAVSAEPNLRGTLVDLPYAFGDWMRTQDDRIGRAWARGSFDTSVPGFNALVSTLHMVPSDTYELRVENGEQVHLITPDLLSESTIMYSNKLVGEAFASVGVIIQRDEGEQYVGDSRWTWTGEGQARIDAETLVGLCLDEIGCGIHYFQVDVSEAGAIVRDKGGFVPSNGLQLGPDTIPLSN